MKVSSKTTVSQLTKKGVTIQMIQDLVDKQIKKQNRAKANEEKAAKVAEISSKVLETISSSEPSKKWKTGNLVKEIFGLTKSLNKEEEAERVQIHGFVSSALKSLSTKGLIQKNAGANSAHTSYSSMTVEVQETEEQQTEE